MAIALEQDNTLIHSKSNTTLQGGSSLPKSLLPRAPGFEASPNQGRKLYEAAKLQLLLPVNMTSICDKKFFNTLFLPVAFPRTPLLLKVGSIRFSPLRLHVCLAIFDSRGKLLVGEVRDVQQRNSRHSRVLVRGKTSVLSLRCMKPREQEHWKRQSHYRKGSPEAPPWQLALRNCGHQDGLGSRKRGGLARNV
ncbi:hypothetical protein AA313_de0210309 [Arthrobotrys entomopaga]|nr:hypothetical protein AA313_de0210309 [Arthrobotrys entomopaga]